jgi:acyl-CoA hydrolase
VTVVVRRMLPSHANPAGAVFGGEILRWCDEAAGIAAGRHARRRVVTAAVDAMEFREPARIGEVLSCKAAVNAVFGSSMEVGVRVEAEDPMTGEVRHTNSAYFVMVALDDDGSPVGVEDVAPGSEDERRRHAQAHERHARRSSG